MSGILTARTLLRHAKLSGLRLTAAGHRVRYDGSGEGANAIKPAMVRLKLELLSVLNGDYFSAARDLLIREGACPSQIKLAEMFDWAAMELRSRTGCTFDEAFIYAYRRLCDAIESVANEQAEVA